jgi:hypothetical protein
MDSIVPHSVLVNFGQESCMVEVVEIGGGLRPGGRLQRQSARKTFNSHTVPSLSGQLVILGVMIKNVQHMENGESVYPIN